MGISLFWYNKMPPAVTGGKACAYALVEAVASRNHVDTSPDRISETTFAEYYGLCSRWTCVSLLKPFFAARKAFWVQLA
jgi:hypothetical protein